MRKQYHTRTIGPDVLAWDIHRLVRLSRDLDVISVPLSEIAELDEDWWYQDEGSVPTPRSITAHMVLVEETDLTHPVILCTEGRLMDGMHRVVKALKEGRRSIQAVRFAETPEPDHVNVSLDDLPYEDEDI